MTFYFPPRPTFPIHSDLIAKFEKMGYWAQIKKNGTCQVITIDGDGKVVFKTRHNEDNKAWSPTPEITETLTKFPETVFIAELLHSKHPSVKDTLYLFDVIKFRGRDLVGETFADRMRILSTIKPRNPKVTVAKQHKSGLTRLFEGLTDPLDEGIVLKNPKARLKSCLRDNQNNGWQVKCRRPTKNFVF